MGHAPRPPAAVTGTVRSRLASQAAVIRVWLLSLGLATAAVIGYFVAIRGLPTLPTPMAIPWPLVAVAFFLAEAKVIDVHFRRESHSFSLSELPSVIGFFFLPPTEYLIALLVGSGVALVFHSRQPPLKVAFNLANFAFIAVVTLTVFRAIGRFGGQPAPIDWLAAFGRDARRRGHRRGHDRDGDRPVAEARRSSRSCPR